MSSDFLNPSPRSITTRISNKIAKKLDRFKTLQKGWISDDQDSMPPSAAIIALAQILIENIEAQYPGVDIFVDPEGGLELYWTDFKAYVTLLNDESSCHLSWIGDANIPDIYQEQQYDSLSTLIDLVRTFMSTIPASIPNAQLRKPPDWKKRELKAIIRDYFPASMNQKAVYLPYTVRLFIADMNFPVDLGLEDIQRLFRIPPSSMEFVDPDVMNLLRDNLLSKYLNAGQSNTLNFANQTSKWPTNLFDLSDLRANQRNFNLRDDVNQFFLSHLKSLEHFELSYNYNASSQPLTITIHPDAEAELIELFSSVTSLAGALSPLDIIQVLTSTQIYSIIDE